MYVDLKLSPLIIKSRLGDKSVLVGQYNKLFTCETEDVVMPEAVASMQKNVANSMTLISEIKFVKLF